MDDPKFIKGGKRLTRAHGYGVRTKLASRICALEEGIMYKVATFVAAMLMSLALTLPTSSALAQQESLKTRIVGTWKPISWETLRPNGQVLNIWMGPHPTGLLVYEPN